MIWNHFPVGFRFPVADESDETKRRCWEIALSALATAPSETYEELTLYDDTVKDAPGSAPLLYICIFNFRHVTQSRAATAVWKGISRLFPYLSLHLPYFQANALSPFSPYPLLADVRTDGTLACTETGKALLPDRLPPAMERSGTRRTLVIGAASFDELGGASQLKKCGLAAAKGGDSVSYMPVANGSEGTTYALTYAQRGRFEWIPAVNTAGETIRVLLGILPNATVTFDAVSLLREDAHAVSRSYALGTAVKAVLDRGYRKLLLPTVILSEAEESKPHPFSRFREADGGEGFFDALASKDDPSWTDPRLSELSITLLSCPPVIWSEAEESKQDIPGASSLSPACHSERSEAESKNLSMHPACHSERSAAESKNLSMHPACHSERSEAESKNLSMRLPGGLLRRLVQNGATIRLAADELETRLNFAKRLAEADRILVCGKMSDAVSERILKHCKGKQPEAV